MEELEVPNAYEIRFDVGYEEEVAERFQELLSQLFEDKLFTLRDANNPIPTGPTRDYISIFLGP